MHILRLVVSARFLVHSVNNLRLFGSASFFVRLVNTSRLVGSVIFPIRSFVWHMVLASSSTVHSVNILSFVAVRP